MFYRDEVVITADVNYTCGSVTTVLIAGDYNTVMTGVNIIIFGRFWNIQNSSGGF